MKKLIAAALIVGATLVLGGCASGDHAPAQPATSSPRVPAPSGVAPVPSVAPADQSTPSPTPTPTPTIHDTGWRFTTAGYGPIALGSAATAVLTDALFVKDAPSKGQCVDLWRWSSGDIDKTHQQQEWNLTVGQIHDHVRYIYATAQRDQLQPEKIAGEAATDAGLTFGSTVADLRAAYPGLKKTQDTWQASYGGYREWVTGGPGGYLVFSPLAAQAMATTGCGASGRPRPTTTSRSADPASHPPPKTLPGGHRRSYHFGRRGESDGRGSLPVSDTGAHEQTPRLDAVQLREAIQIADNISLSGAANALRNAQGAERAEVLNAYIELRRALIDASQQDPDEWSERSSTAPAYPASQRATALFWVRAGTTVVMLVALFVITGIAAANANQSIAAAIAPYVSLIAGLAGIGLGWMFGTVGRPVETGSSKTKPESRKLRKARGQTSDAVREEDGT